MYSMFKARRMAQGKKEGGALFVRYDGLADPRMHAHVLGQDEVVSLSLPTKRKKTKRADKQAVASAFYILVCYVYLGVCVARWSEILSIEAFALEKLQKQRVPGTWQYIPR